MNPMKKRMHLALVCGGPSLERGISLNSARSVADHLQPLVDSLSIFYVSPLKTFHMLEVGHLYSNTPMDFDFKLASFSPPLSEKEFIERLKEADLVFPVIHGTFGEDGDLQGLLEAHRIPFVGPSSKTCAQMYHKPRAKEVLDQAGFFAWPSLEVSREEVRPFEAIQEFFEQHAITRAVVKPSAGGSSIGVHSVETPAQALEKAYHIFEENIYDQALIEPFCPGKEFTLIVLQSESGEPVALVPSEIQISYEGHGVFDYRRKYLPTANTHWMCPPTFSEDIIQKIQRQGEELFRVFGIRDFTRMDGWVLDSGEILFTDFNPISGMEQNSFIFQQGAWVGMSHQQLLHYILSRACERYGLSMPPLVPQEKSDKTSIAVLFGGYSAERQVSLMSGTNVWLKLRQSEIYDPQPYFMDLEGVIWQIPYAYALSHTVEEIAEKCQNSAAQTAKLAPLQKGVRKTLGLASLAPETPVPFSLEAFCLHAKKMHEFVFIGLHGGMGEDGTLQKLLDAHGLKYNGSGPKASALCMDKKWTADLIKKAQISGVDALSKVILEKGKTADQLWKEACALPGEFREFILKPQSDGCSAGVVLLRAQEHLQAYLDLMEEKAPYIPGNTFPGQASEIELPSADTTLMIEPYIETDKVRIKNHDLWVEERTGWVELTVGVLEKQGVYHSLNPSMTVASHAVLSLEEKFQGGTGVNLTPPPEVVIPTEKIGSIKQRCEEIARVLGIQNYCRIDVFYHAKRDQLIVIEANSLPALTPSTVIYHQALAEREPLAPRAFLEKIIDTSR